MWAGPAQVSATSTAGEDRCDNLLGAYRTVHMLPAVQPAGNAIHAALPGKAFIIACKGALV